MNEEPEDIIGAAPAALESQTAEARPPTPADLSGEVERTVERERPDTVRCVRVFGDFYRCNWWAPPADVLRNAATEWLTTSTQRVRKSSFLNVTVSDGKLVIREVTLGHG